MWNPESWPLESSGQLKLNKTFASVIYKFSVAIVLEPENNTYNCKLHL